MQFMAIKPTLQEKRMLRRSQKRLAKIFKEAIDRWDAVRAEGDDFDILAELQRILHKVVGFLFYCRHYREADEKAYYNGSLTKIVRMSREMREAEVLTELLDKIPYVDEALAGIKHNLLSPMPAGAVDETLWTKNRELRRRRWRKGMNRVRNMFRIAEHRYEWHEIPRIDSVPAEEQYLELTDLPSAASCTNRKLVSIAASSTYKLYEHVIEIMKPLAIMRSEWHERQNRLRTNCNLIKTVYENKVKEYATQSRDNRDADDEAADGRDQDRETGERERVSREESPGHGDRNGQQGARSGQAVECQAGTGPADGGPG
jgi:hypothetical protein